ncbi:MAG: HTH gntR-type domain-containing protein [Lactococcus sp.]|jgi:GntR family transcriptional regulator / MocR family aminotransferase
MIILDKESKETLYQQLYCQIKVNILSGIYTSHEKLTGSRTLAKILDISRNTVDKAYSQLVLEGYITAKTKSGFYVAALPETFGNTREKIEVNQDIDKKEETETQPKVCYDLTNSSHTSNLFPKKMWRKHSLEALDTLEKEEKISSLQNNQGELVLREILLTYLQEIRGVHCTVEQIIITSGLQQSLDYLCQIVPKKSQTVLMEEPGYPKARVIFENHQLAITSSELDDKGLVIANHLSQDLDLIYTTPSHQFPTGVTMPIGRRKELLAFAETKNAFIVEDDYDSELRYYEKPIPALQSIDNLDRVVYLGTFSKALSPSLRMSYMILPKPLLGKFKYHFEQFNSTVNLLNQYTVASILESGDYHRIVRRMNHIFKKRFESFVKAFSVFGHRIKISKNVSGQYFLIEFNQKINQNLMIEKALEQGVRVYATMEFWQEKASCPDNALFLGISKIQTEDIHDCVMRLKKAWIDLI